MIVFGIVGWKNSGKTYLAQKIIAKLTDKNFKVASIKHAHHNFDIDHPKTDSFLHRQSGSQQIIVSSSKRWVKIFELNKAPEKKLAELLNELDNPDIVIIEGFKNEKHPKIEIIKDPLDSKTFMFNKDFINIKALVSDIKIDSFKKKQFKKDEINEIVNFILSYKNE